EQVVNAVQGQAGEVGPVGVPGHGELVGPAGGRKLPGETRWRRAGYRSRLDSVQRGLVSGRQRDLVRHDHRAPLAVPLVGDERPVAEPLAVHVAERVAAWLPGYVARAPAAVVVVANAVGAEPVIHAGVRDAGRGLQLVVEFVREGALDREVGDHADRGAAEGEQRDQAGDQPAAEAAG